MCVCGSKRRQGFVSIIYQTRGYNLYNVGIDQHCRLSKFVRNASSPLAYIVLECGMVVILVMLPPSVCFVRLVTINAYATQEESRSCLIGFRSDEPRTRLVYPDLHLLWCSPQLHNFG